MKKVKIKYLPKAVYGMNVTGKINNADGSLTNRGSFMYDDNGIPDVAVKRTLAPTTRENATLEAEVGETVVTELDKANSGGIPEFYTVGGKRHSQGGTPLNLPPDSFIFSRDNKMKIKDSDILAQFGKSVGKSKKGFTPADLSKQYDINKYRAVLADPTSDFHSINTAKQMIENYNLKLGGLAMVQESVKGFDNGIPAIAMPYLDSVGIDPMSLLPQQEQAPMQQMPMAKWGGSNYFQKGGPNVGDIDPYASEVVNEFNFQNVNNPIDYLHNINETSASNGMARNVDKDSFFNQWNQQPQSANLQYAKDDQGGWNVVRPTQAPTPMQQQQAAFQPSFVERDGQRFQTRPTTDLEKYPSGTFEQATNATMAAMYAKKFGIPNPYNTLDESNKEALAAITLKQTGGAVLNEYAAGGSVKSQKVPSLAELQKQGLAKWDMTAEGYNEADVQPGDYIKKADGKWYKATMEDIATIPYTGAVDPKLGILGEAYGRLEERLLTNKDLRKALYSKYKDNMAKAKPRNNLSEVDLEAARSLSEDEVVKNFLEAQKQIMAVQAKGPIKDEAGAWDSSLSNYTNTVSELGFQPMNAAQTAAFQGAYVSMQNLMDADPEFRKQLSDFLISDATRLGKADEAGGGTGKANISDIDGWFGNTTVGQSLLYAPKAKELQMKEAEWNAAQEDPAVKHLADQYRANQTPFWTEDIINEAFALKNLWGIERQQPWNAIPGTKLPNPTFLTPDQQIQNILGATGQGTITIGAFGNPQAFTANFAGMHGNAMNQVANVIGNVQDKNVQVANQFALQRSQIMNHANERNAQLATNLHDKNAILNQQFTNAKNQAWDGVRRGMVNMWTNRGKTQNLNTFNDQYQIDPRTGFKIFTNGRPIAPKDAQNNDIYTLASEYKRTSPDMNWNEALNFAKASKGIKSPTGFTGVDPTEMGAGYPGGMPSGYYQG